VGGTKSPSIWISSSQVSGAAGDGLVAEEGIVTAAGQQRVVAQVADQLVVPVAATLAAEPVVAIPATDDVIATGHVHPATLAEEVGLTGKLARTRLTGHTPQDKTKLSDG